MNELILTILGCGSSGGVPRLGNNWGLCDPKNPKNRRRRCSLLAQRVSADGTTNVLIDTSPDMREQLLDVNVQHLDGVIYTHDHADHVHGLDDLRMFYLINKTRLPIYADPQTQQAIRARFRYLFEQPQGSEYPPILAMNDLPCALCITGPGGPIHISTHPVAHGRTTVQGIKINNVLYTPDISGFYESPPDFINDLQCWIIDALRQKPHPTHFHLQQALEWIARARPRQAILTNLHIDLDYAQLCDNTPQNVHPAYDGLQLRYDIDV